MVEIYLPIKNIDNAIVGSFEIYLDFFKYRNNVATRLQEYITLTMTTILVIIIALYAVMRYGMKSPGNAR